MVNFTEIFEDVTRLGRKLPTSEYKNEGKYAIIDQGQKDIVGYTDEEEGLFTDVPAIVFGDHTRTIKYVDQPCFLGADGTKLLKAKLEEANYKYLYYALSNVNIPDTGYNRHFKWLKESEFNLPSDEKQKEIVAKLDKVTDLINKRKEQIAKLDELIKARFVEMFGDIGEEMPLSCYIKSLDAGRSLAGEEYCENKVLKTGAVSYDFFDPTQVKNLPTDYVPQVCHMVQTGDIIISRMNTTELVGAVGYVWEVPKNTFLPDRLWRAKLCKNVNPIFVWQLLIQDNTKKKIRRIATGTSGSMKNISKQGLLGITVKKVNLSLQNEFAAFVEQTDKVKQEAQKSLEELETLKKALMQEYFG